MFESLDAIQDALLLFGLILARLIAIINLTPFLGSKNAPHQAKIGMAILFSMIFWPHVSSQMHLLPESGFVYMLFLLKELFIGFTIGFVTAQIFYSVEMMGQIIDVVRGTNQAQLLVPQLQERSSAFGDFNYQFLLVLFLSLGFQVPFFETLAESFIQLPILSFAPQSIDGTQIMEFFARLLSDVFRIAVTLAFPIAFVCLLSDIAFGLLNRVAPQINAYFMSMPAKAAGGMVIFLAGFSVIADQFARYSLELLNVVRETIYFLK
jgi:flagellar biosynthetic protein FliR